MDVSNRECAVTMAANRIALGAADLAEIAQRTLLSTNLNSDRKLLKSIKNHLDEVRAVAGELQEAVKARASGPRP